MNISKNFVEECEFNDSNKSTEESLNSEDNSQNNEEFIDIERNDKDKQIAKLIKSEKEKDKENKLNKPSNVRSETKINVKNSPEKDDKTFCPLDEKYTYDPYLESNFINRFFFFWAYKILKIAKKYKLKITDLGKPAPSNNANNFLKDFNKIWEDLGYKNYKNYALLRTILRINIYSIILIIISSIFQAGLDYFSLIITKQFIDYFNKTGNKEYSTYLVNVPLWGLGLIFIGTQILLVLINLNTQMIQINFGNKVGYQLNCFIYSKILNYSSSGFTNEVNQGEIINFIQIDSMRLLFLVCYSPNALMSPFIIITYIYLLFDFFNFTFIFGLIVIIMYIILNYYISKEVRIRQKRMMEKKDLCMKVTSEALENIKILKLYNWENEFKKRIIESRKIEMDYTEKRFAMINLIRSMNYLCPTLISILTIGVYNLFNDSFNISTMLIGLSIFSKLQTPIKMIQNLICMFIDAIVSFKRIEDFLKQPDIKREIIHKGEYDINGEYAIKINGGNFSWGLKQKQLKIEDTSSHKKTNNKKKIKDSKFVSKNKKGIFSIINKIGKISNNKNVYQLNEDNQENEDNNEKEKDGYKIQINIPKDIDYNINLKNINLEIKPAELVAIIGEVGSGKSSLLQAIINNLILLNPKECDGIHINGKIGYSAQIPWISNDTIRNNIPYYPNSYHSNNFKQVKLK